ncbi:MAG: hypothetical protein P4L55_08885 [Syntrophobacteraceae bacterium]|nr:hypothetical protein [Syntrophobacteraceae bacterium]
MKREIPAILFDRRDYELLSLVDEVLKGRDSLQYLKDLLYPWFHPHGIKELAASPALRMAYAALRLLESLEAGKAEERISALRSLRDEVMSSGEVHMRRNGARVLLEIMKEMVRKPDGRLGQLKLAHDFRAAVIGRPRSIRSLLRRYHLLEMPENWDQVSFDDHIHDSSTKGRKSPSHLIMDAWIKGIRRLTVVYYNYVPPMAAEELLEAAEIMGVAVRIGIGFSVRFYGAYIQLIYAPAGLSDPKDFLSFLGDRRTKGFMEEGREVSAHQSRYILKVLGEFNRNQLPKINQRYGLNLDVFDPSAFLAYVGEGQPSILHLAKFIHRNLVPAMCERGAALKGVLSAASRDERERMIGLVDEMNGLDSEAIVERFLRSPQNPGIADPHHVPVEGADIPNLLKLTPPELVDRLNGLRAGCRIRLNLTNLKAEDVLELLYMCKGAISDLEIFNLKDFSTGKAGNYREINELQRAINEENTVGLKKLILAMIRRMHEGGSGPERIAKFHEILRNIPTLQAYYRKGPLRSKIGSDSTGHSHRLHGMGLAILETLVEKAQREVRVSKGPQRLIVPVRIDAFSRNTYIPERRTNYYSRLLYSLLSHVPGLGRIGLKCEEGWEVDELSTRIQEKGNVVTLGGISGRHDNGIHIIEKTGPSGKQISWAYLNEMVKNAIKITAGFIPAFLSFYLTKDWWVLAWLGAPIWFAITGLRNIIQSVFGAGGFRPSSLIKWDSYISWGRISDSLFFTGVSVPLLDYLVKTVILDRGFSITTSTRPVLLYALIALANGVYIFCHNQWRGLPKGTATSNLLFRTVLSIPLAFLINQAAGGVMGVFGVSNISGMLERWAAIISKAASDTIAGVIEGLADRNEYIQLRADDYAGKLKQLFDAYAQLELMYPEADVLKMLETPADFMMRLSSEARDLEKIIIVNGLDLLYFWMYQPRARYEFRSVMEGMSRDEREILVRSQSVLRRRQEVSQLLREGIAGKKYEKALSFYLDCSEEYLNVIEGLQAVV